jgi:hypothetical protein
VFNFRLDIPRLVTIRAVIRYDVKDIMKKILPLLLLLALFAAACTGKNGNKDSNAETADDGQEYPAFPWPALARLCAGENPIWFEFGQDGPVLIESAAAASLTPYVPWPYARYVTAMAMWDGFLVIAVNRDGFIIFGPAGGPSQQATTAVILYRSSAGSLWDPYTTESFFIWEGKPAVLLYRNDFFGKLEAPTPNPRVYALEPFSPNPVGAYVPALEVFPSDRNWETELLRRGSDGLWYYRMKEKGQDRSATAYFRTADLNVEGEKVSLGEWMNSGRGEAPQNIPLNLALALEASGYLSGTGGLLKTVSPDFEGQRIFAAGIISAIAENNSLLYAYCQGGPLPLALAILPGGLGFISTGDGREAIPFSLPALPEGFAYTGVAVLGNAIIASWEEQQEAGVGAAGFMAMALAFQN